MDIDINIKTCANCGNEFSVESMRIDTRYCSTRCKDEHNNRTKAIRRKEQSILKRIKEIQTMLDEETNTELKKELKIAIQNIQSQIMPHYLKRKRF